MATGGITHDWIVATSPTFSLALYTSPFTSSVPTSEGLTVLWMYHAFLAVHLLSVITTMSCSYPLTRVDPNITS